MPCCPGTVLVESLADFIQSQAKNKIVAASIPSMSLLNHFMYHLYESNE
jgi:hypothetical protein